MSDYTIFSGAAGRYQHKAKYFALILCFFFSFQYLVPQNAFSQWTWQNPLPTGSSFVNLSFLDANNAIVVGQTGTSGISTDGGTNWTIFGHGISPTFSFSQVSYRSLNTAFATALDANSFTSGIYKTTNGGMNWVQSFGTLGQLFMCITFVDANTGYTGGSDLMTGLALIMKTTDNGNTWEPQTPGISTIIYRINFVDANTGTAVGDGGKILRTTNGGTNWIEQNSNTVTPLLSVSFADANNGIISGEGGLALRTVNGGVNWDSIGTGVTGPLRSAYMLNPSTSFIAGTDCVLRTTDGGNSWINIQPNGTFHGVTFLNANTGIVVGGDGLALKTTNGGQDWFTNSSGPTIALRNIFFSTQSMATAVGDNGMIMQTTNAGQNWVIKPSGVGNQLFGVCFVGNTTGYAVGSGGVIIKTTDKGNSWVPLASGVIAVLTKAYFTDVNTGTAVGASGTIIKTTNGGDSWIAQTSGLTQALNDVYFFDANTGIIVGASGRILRTTNGGDNWVSQTSGSAAYNGVAFADANTGIAVGASSRLVKTTNGGLNWTAITTGITGTYQSATYADANNVFISGNSGMILKSTNGGSNWTRQVTGTGSNLIDMFFTDAFSGTSVGTGGTILRQQVAPVNSNFGSNNQTGSNLYYFANSLSLTAPSHPDFTWRDTTGSISLYADGSNRAPGIFTGDNDNGRWNLLAQLGGGNIRFFGSDYSNIYIGTNGIVGFNAFDPSIVQPPILGLRQSLITEAIFPLWMNMNIDYSGVDGRRISYKVTATELIITYNRIPVYAQTSLTNDHDRYVSFQVIIKFNNGSPSQNSQIFISYNNDETGPVFVSEYNSGTLRSHAVGIQKNNDIEQFFQYRYSNSISVLTDGPLFGSNLTLAMGDNPNVLPVELASFNSLVVKNEVILDWSTVSEINNASFEVERTQALSNNYSKIGSVQGNGTSNEVNHYKFNDRNVQAGKYKYRLKQIDFNGNYEYIDLSNEVIVGIPTKYDLSQNYPNPFNPVTKINFEIPVDSKVTLKLFDISGREVATLVNDQRTAGYYTVTFDAQSFASGIYFYRVTAGDNAQFTMTKKMMLVK